MFYKLYHIPTGLYFKPCRNRFKSVKSSLHDMGKTYDCKPNLSWLRDGVISPEGVYFPFTESEWEIIEYSSEVPTLRGALGDKNSGVKNLNISDIIDMYDSCLRVKPLPENNTK